MKRLPPPRWTSPPTVGAPRWFGGAGPVVAVARGGGPARRRAGSGARPGPPLLPLLGPLAVARHRRVLSGLAVVGVPTAPAAVLPQLDAVGVVALALVG